MKRLTALALFFAPILCLAQEAADKANGSILSLKDGAGMKMEVTGTDSPWAMLVPIVLFLVIGLIVYLKYYWNFRETVELQQSIRLMVEKNVPVPMELLVRPPEKVPSSQKDFRRGLILIAAGLSFAVCFAVNEPNESVWTMGLIPFAIGVAYIVASRLSHKTA